MKPLSIRPLIIFSCLFLSAPVLQNKIFAQCTSTPARSATVFANDANPYNDFAFSTPGNASASDNNRASAIATIFNLTGNTNYLKATGFGFSIPVSASICGITVEVEKSATNISILAWVNDNSVRLIKNGTVTGNDYKSATNWTTSENYTSYGGISDLWGTTWSAGEVNAANFGVDFSAGINGILGLLASARIDHVRVTVHYFNVALSVKLLNFSAIAQVDHSAKINWTTADNDEAALFSTQRSSNGADWVTLHDQQGEISIKDKTYQYTDNTCSGNTAFYRLQILHASGRLSYSPVVQVNFSSQQLNLYPNPATDHIFIQYDGNTDHIECFSPDGKKRLLNYVKTGSDLLKFDISRLPPGTYIIRINDKKRLFVKY